MIYQLLVSVVQASLQRWEIPDYVSSIGRWLAEGKRGLRDKEKKLLRIQEA